MCYPVTPGGTPDPNMTIELKFEHFKRAIRSISDSLKLTNVHFPNRALPDIQKLEVDLSEYLKIITPVVNPFFDRSIGNADIWYLEKICKDVGRVYKELVRAITWLRIAYDIRILIDEALEKATYIDLRYRYDYYQCLDGCRSALLKALENM